jgi:hypothetical protein
MLMLLAVSLALLVTGFACRGAEFECGTEDAVVRTCAARSEIGRHAANVRAIEVETDALAQMLDRRFG